MDTAVASKPPIPTIPSASTIPKPSEPTKVSPNPKTTTSRSGECPSNYRVPHGSNELEMPSPFGESVPGPTIYTHPTRCHGDVCRITWTSPRGSSSGSNWIGSFPPMLDIPWRCTYTATSTHPFHPCPGSGKPCTETSID